MNAWDRQPDEPSRWYDRFERYRLAGPGRSLLAVYVAERETARKGAIKSVPGAWNAAAARWGWRERAAAFDTAEARALSAQILERRARRRAELEEADWDDGHELREQARALLGQLQITMRRTETTERIKGVLVRTITLTPIVNLSAIGQALQLASVLQHRSTDAQRVVEEQIEAALDRLRDALTEEEYARALAALMTAPPARWW